MLRRPEIDALIVGAGPVGLFHALVLARRGARVRIIDQEWRTAAESYALTLHPRTLELADELIPGEKLIERGVRIESVAFYDGAARRAQFELSRLSGRFPFALALPQSVLETLLEQRLEEVGISVHWNERLLGLRTEDGWTSAEIGRLAPSSSADAAAGEWGVESTYEIRPRFVVGADGVRSRVRQILDIEFEPVAPPEFYGVFEFECDAYREAEARVVFDDETTNVLWPLPDGRARWSFQLPEPVEVPGEGSKRRWSAGMAPRTFQPLNELLLQRLIEERAPWFDGLPGRLAWSAAVQFRPRLVSQFGRGRVWLAGDAAHQTGPVGVQSMNIALREGRDLAERLMKILGDRSSLDALARYDAERTAEWRRLLGLDPAPPPSGEAWVTRNRTRILPCLPASGSDLDDLLDPASAMHRSA